MLTVQAMIQAIVKAAVAAQSHPAASPHGVPLQGVPPHGVPPQGPYAPRRQPSPPGGEAATPLGGG